MEWLKQLLGEENYNKLVANGTIEMLKTAMGDNEYIPNDPTKIIPKNVFNEKLSIIKTLEQQIETYKTQIANYGDMVTDKDMKTQLETQKLEFERQIKEIKKEAEIERDNNNKLNLLKNYLVQSGCQYPDLLMNQINLDNIVLDNDKKNILNGDKIVLPLQENYKNLFEKKITGSTPQGGSPVPQPKITTKTELIKKYEEAEKTGNGMQMMQLQREIQSFKE